MSCLPGSFIEEEESTSITGIVWMVSNKRRRKMVVKIG